MTIRNKKDKEDNILLNAVEKITKPTKSAKSAKSTKTPTSLERRTPKRKNKTPKQKGGDSNFLGEIEQLLFRLNNQDNSKLQIYETSFPLTTQGKKEKKDKAEQQIVTINDKTVDSKPFNPIIKGQPGGSPGGSTRVAGGFGKEYINNYMRLYDGSPNNYYYSSI